MVLLPLFPLLNAVLSINSEGPCGTPTRWHAVCSLIRNIKDWLPGVAGTDPRLGYRFGASITKRGLAPAPFFISGVPPSIVCLRLGQDDWSRIPWVPNLTSYLGNG